MKNRIHFLAFLGIFILMIIPKNVFAKEIYPFSININNIAFTNSSTSYDHRLNMLLGATNGTLTLDVAIESYSYAPTNENYSFQDYPYTVIVFNTWNTLDKIGVSKSSSCSTSCFGKDSMALNQIGTEAGTGRRRYVLILENKRWSTDCGNGNGQCVYHIDDQITFTNLHQDARYFNFYQVLLTDDISVFNNTQVDIDKMISNATANSQNIINNQNSNTQNIINNQNSNTSDILQNDRQNTTNIIQNQNTNQSQTNEKLDNVNNTMKDESGVSNNDVSSKTTEWSNKLAGTGPVSQMVLMPITLLNGYVTGFNSTCSPYNLGSLYGTNIILPCINISNYLGTSLWGVIDILISGFMIFAMGKKFVKIFNDFTNLRDNQMDELYGGGK